ncbi:MAG: WecB/TagA/CpsF family glycosyltransferase [Leptospiraceae bacterium]|nr:WecB/TagA/CpsF family glycosyltransferase [Leptospiraceae bacterium]MCK6379891.1 WecB/TagA/CpsF family glycosyltransferase [Leptospiraceae bacterium]NUM40228.1 WecB/TagA/CpsF family glycosyltransferase [Leptospiraceae bacterium]
MKEISKIGHNSSKEERDFLLEYKAIDLKSLEQFTLGGVTFDNVTIDESIAKIISFVEKKDKHYHILFLDPIKFMYMRKGAKLARIAEKASMVLADGSGLGWAARKMGFILKERISVIGLMMDIVRMAEKKNFTIFMLGSKEDIIEKVFFNLIRHFPDLRIVGRHSGHMNAQRELMVKEAIRKTSPDIIFLGLDYPEQEIWIENNTGYLGKSVIVGVGGAFDILSGKIKKAPDYFQVNGLTWLWRIIVRPYRINRVFKLLYFIILGILKKY